MNKQLENITEVIPEVMPENFSGFNQEPERETIKLRQEVTPDMLATRKIRKMFGIRLQPYVRIEPKVGRNEPCPCGSLKKYKKCCGMTN